MAKKAASKAPEVEITPEVASLLDFWKDVVRGRVQIADAEGALKEILVPLEVRIRASELLAKYMIPIKGRLVEAESEESKLTTPDILRVAQMLENEQHDDVLQKAFEAVRARKTT